MKIVLHAGAWKTGSSAIQVFLKKNLRPLARKGVIVPRMAKQMDGHQKIFDRLTHEDDAEAAPYLDELRAIAAETPDATVVVSSEHFWPLPQDRLTRAARRLQSVTEDVRALLYVRPQEQMWGSLYAQQAKFFRIGAATARWGNHDYVGPDIVDRALYYDRCLDVFDAAFGAEKVDARVYARQRFHGGNVISDFLRHIGVESEDGLRFDSFDRNPSLGWKGVSFSIWFRDHHYDRLLAANQGHRSIIRECFTRSYAETRTRFRDRAWVGDAAQIFSEAELRDIRDHYAEDNRALFDRRFNGEDVFGAVKKAEKTPLGLDRVPERQLRHVRGRLLVNLMRVGVDVAPVECDLIPDAARLRLAKMVERSPIGWLDRRTKSPLVGGS